MRDDSGSRELEDRLVTLLLILALLFILVLAMIPFSGLHPVGVFAVYILIPLLSVMLVVPLLRKRLPGFEMRANGIVVGTLYTALVIILALGFHALIQHPAVSNELRETAGVLMAIGGALLSASLYPRFRSVILRRLLGIPLGADELAKTAAGAVALQLDSTRLTSFWTETLLPSLMVTQGALVQSDEGGLPGIVASKGVAPGELPTAAEFKILMENAGRYRPIPDEDENLPCAWVRLALPLNVEGRTIGACLFGRRDPDDFYSGEELPLLRSIADQVALALYNIKQSERLRAFYQANTLRYEQERTTLAHELHDQVLHDLAHIIRKPRETPLPESLLVDFQKVLDHIRGLVYGLRPPMMEYGLRYSLLSLIDEMREQAPWATITLDHPEGEPTIPRLPRPVEEHFYRIAQEACRNALKSSGEKCHIHLTIKASDGYVELSIRDDGPGFDAGERLDLNRLLANRHFGLATMFERSQLAGADLKIHSAPGLGTEVQVIWKSDGHHPGN